MQLEKELTAWLSPTGRNRAEDKESAKETEKEWVLKQEGNQEFVVL